MHELSITQNIVAIVDKQAAGRRVTRVRVRIGKLSGIEAQSVRFCFELCTPGTNLHGAVLEIDEVEGRAACESCGKAITLQSWMGRCPCPEKGRLRIEQGEELLVKEMEVR
ncbi:MAG: hydrogenase maturation nickel metallochaperone HypA [Myxococcota bacterium]